MDEVLEFFDQRAENWDKNTTRDTNRLKQIIQDLPIKKGDKVLDLGCGTGVISELLFQKSQSDVFAIDLSPKMIEVAKQKNQNDKIHFSAENFYNYQGNDFSVIVVFDAYPHFLDVENFKNKCLEVLIDGGYLCIVHDIGRDELNDHHFTFAKKISRGLNDVRSEAQFYMPEFHVIDAREDDNNYRIIAQKR